MSPYNTKSSGKPKSGGVMGALGLPGGRRRSRDRCTISPKPDDVALQQEIEAASRNPVAISRSSTPIRDDWSAGRISRSRHSTHSRDDGRAVSTGLANSVANSGDISVVGRALGEIPALAGMTQERSRQAWPTASQQRGRRLGTQRRCEAEWGCTPSGRGRASANFSAELAEPRRLAGAGRGAPPLRGNQTQPKMCGQEVSTLDQRQITGHLGRSRRPQR